MTRLPSFVVAAAFVAFGSCASAAVMPATQLAKGPGPDWCSGPRATSNHAPMRAETTPTAHEKTATVTTKPDAEATTGSSGCPSLTQR